MANFNLDSFILYDNVRTDEVVETGVRIFNEFFYREYISYMEADYFRVQRLLLKATEKEEIQGTYWQNYICSLVARSANRFSVEAARGRLNENLKKLIVKEIGILKALYAFDWAKVATVFKDEETSVCCMLTAPEREFPAVQVQRALTAESPEESTDILFAYYYHYGVVTAPAEKETID